MLQLYPGIWSTGSASLVAPEVLRVTAPSTGNTHTVCPHCFRNPPVGAAPDQDFRCFMCKARCQLAGGNNW